MNSVGKEPSMQNSVRQNTSMLKAPTCLALISTMIFVILQSGDVKAQETIKQLLDNPPQERIEAFENFANTHENGYTETGSTPNGEYKIIMKNEGFKRFCFSFTDKEGIEGSLYIYLEEVNEQTKVCLYNSPSTNFPDLKNNLNEIVKIFINTSKNGVNHTVNNLLNTLQDPEVERYFDFLESGNKKPNPEQQLMKGEKPHTNPHTNTHIHQKPQSKPDYLFGKQKYNFYPYH